MGVGARARQRQPGGSDGARLSRHGQRPAEARRRPRAEPGSRVLAAPLSAEARGEHGVSRISHPDVRERTARGLGLDEDDVVATASAWEDAPRPDPQRYPYYFRWHFRTGTSGDFETLVRLLTPKPVNRRVGTRDVDVQFPGSTVRGVDKPELDGVLRLGGALRPPPTVPPPQPDVYDTWDDPMPRPLQEDLARLLNLPDDYTRPAIPIPCSRRRSTDDGTRLTNRVFTKPDGSRIAGRQLDSPAEPGPPAPHRCRARHARHPGSAGIVHGRGMGASRTGARGATEDPVRSTRRSGQHGLAHAPRRAAAGARSAERPDARRAAEGANPECRDDGVHSIRRSLVQPTLTSSAFRRAIRPRGRAMRMSALGAPARPARCSREQARGERRAAAGRSGRRDDHSGVADRHPDGRHAARTRGRTCPPGRRHPPLAAPIFRP